jgi:hypothetical protein
MKSSRWREFPILPKTTPAARYFELACLYGATEIGSFQFYPKMYLSSYTSGVAVDRKLTGQRKIHIVCRARAIAAAGMSTIDTFDAIEKMVGGVVNLRAAFGYCAVIKAIYSTRNKQLVKYLIDEKVIPLFGSNLNYAMYCAGYEFQYFAQSIRDINNIDAHFHRVVKNNNIDLFKEFVKYVIENRRQCRSMMEMFFEEVLLTFNYVKINIMLTACRDAGINLRVTDLAEVLVKLGNVTLCLHVLPYLNVNNRLDLRSWRNNPFVATDKSQFKRRLLSALQIN